MTTTEKNFIVGETVGHYIGEACGKVKVVAVEGKTVTVDLGGYSRVFTQRDSDGRYVAEGNENYAVMPEMIFHFQSDPEPVKQSFWQKVKSFF